MIFNYSLFTFHFSLKKSEAQAVVSEPKPRMFPDSREALLGILLLDLAVVLHGVIDLEVADNGEGRTVVVATGSTCVGGAAP